MGAALGLVSIGHMQQIIVGAVSLWDRLRALGPDLRCSNDLLMDMVKTGSPSDRMAAIITLKEELGLTKLELFLKSTGGLSALLDVLEPDEPAADAEDDPLDWRSALWELLLFILQNREALDLDERDLCSAAIITRVLSLVKAETDRRRALQFLLAEPNRSSAGRTFIVESGGIPLLIDALRSERDDETVAQLLELLHNIAASSTSHVQEIDLLVQNIVNCSQPDELDFTLLLLLVYHERLPPYERSETPAERQNHLQQFTLQACVNLLYLASASRLHKYIALKCVRKALPEIGFAFVFDHDGIPLLWDVLMQTEAPAMTDLAIEILRWLARENQAFGDHILDFCSTYGDAQEPETERKAESIRFQIFGGHSKRKRSGTDGTDASDGRIGKQARFGEPASEIANDDGAGRLELDVDATKANETDSDADSDWGEIIYSSSGSDAEDLESALESQKKFCESKEHSGASKATD